MRINVSVIKTRKIKMDLFQQQTHFFLCDLDFVQTSLTPILRWSFTIQHKNII